MLRRHCCQTRNACCIILYQYFDEMSGFSKNYRTSLVSTLPLLYLQEADSAYIFKCHAVLERLCEWARHCSSDNKGEIWSRDTLIDQDTVTMFTKANILAGKTSASSGATPTIVFRHRLQFLCTSAWLDCDTSLNISCDICFCFYPALHQMTPSNPPLLSRLKMGQPLYFMQWLIWLNWVMEGHYCCM